MTDPSEYPNHPNLWDPAQEPTDAMGRLAKLHDHAYLAVRTNMLKPLVKEADMTAYLLLFSMIELAGAIVVLCRERRCIGIPALARSVLEAHVELTNLLANDVHYENLKAANLDRWQKFSQEASTGKNPLLKTAHETPDFKEFRSQVKHRQKALKPGAKRLDFEEKFEAVGLTNEYKSIWQSLSASVHHDLTQLYERHTIPGIPQQAFGIYTGGSHVYCNYIASAVIVWLFPTFDAMLKRFDSRSGA